MGHLQKASRRTGYKPDALEALARSVSWYLEHGYVKVADANHLRMQAQSRP